MVHILIRYFITSVAPDAPPINRISAQYTSIRIEWSKPATTNGFIRKYEVCWRYLARVPKCHVIKHSAVPNDTYNIPSLTPGIRHHVSVSAFTNGGWSALSEETINTTKSGKGYSAQTQYMYEDQI